MREIHRTIVSALLFSKDNKILMWRRDPNGGGVYPDCRHIPWGGVEEWESLEQAVIREVQEEIGLDISPYEIIQLPHNNTWTTEKTLKETGEKVLCHMEFNRFKIQLDHNAQDIEVQPTNELVEIKWFDSKELAEAKQIPGGKEFFQKMWYIK